MTGKAVEYLMAGGKREGKGMRGEGGRGVGRSRGRMKGDAWKGRKGDKRELWQEGRGVLDDLEGKGRGMKNERGGGDRRTRVRGRRLENGLIGGQHARTSEPSNWVRRGGEPVFCWVDSMKPATRSSAEQDETGATRKRGARGFFPSSSGPSPWQPTSGRSASPLNMQGLSFVSEYCRMHWKKRQT